MGRNSCRGKFPASWASVAGLLALVLLQGCCLIRNLDKILQRPLLVDKWVTFAPVERGQSTQEEITVLNRHYESVTLERVVVGPRGEEDGTPLFDSDFAGPITLREGDATSILFTYTADGFNGAQGSAVLFTTVGEYRVNLRATRPRAELSVSPRDHEFNRTRIGECSEMSLVLRNKGQRTIDITQLSFPTLATEFIVEPSAMALLPRRLGVPRTREFSDTWTVPILHCAGPRARTSTDLTIEWTHSNDEEEETLVSFTVDQTPPCLAVNPADDLIELGEVPVGTVVEQLFRIENCAVGDRAQGLWVNQVSLEPTDDEGSGDTFLLSGEPEEPVLLQPADSLEVLVTFAPVEAGQTESATLSIISTDPAQAVRHIELTGTGVASP